MNTSYPAIYKRGKIWYFKYTDYNGKRKQVSTGEALKRDARDFMINHIDKLNSGVRKIKFAELIEPFKKAETNPKYLYAQTVQENYGKAHAKNVASMFVRIEELLKDTHYLRKEVSDFIRADVKKIQALIVEKYGKTNTSNKIFKQLKVAFNYAVDEGYMPVSPTYRIADVKFEKKKIRILPVSEIARVFPDSSMFPNTKAWTIFAIEAFTGMRRSEVLALTWGQINNGSIMIDRAFKDSKGEVGLPKWDKVRAIPIGDTITHIIDEYRKSLSTYKQSDLLFSTSSGRKIDFRNYDQWFLKVKEKAISTCSSDDIISIWQNFTPHALRHSLNTNLLIYSGESEVMIRKYLSWTSQNSSAIQENYTHIEAEELRPIANAINEMYTPKDGDNVLKFRRA